MKRDSKGYAFPTPIDPQATVCIRVRVPADPLYIGAFFRSYRYFGEWVAWERDAAHTGKQVAAVWLPAIAQTIAEWDAAQGECGMIDVRQSPTNPCLLEAQYTPGGAWVQFADLTLCKPAVGGPLYGVGQSWRETDDMLWHLKSKLAQVNTWLAGGMTADQIKIFVAPQSAQAPSLTAMIDSLASMNQATRDATLAAINWQTARWSVYCDPACQTLYPGQYYQWLDCISGKMLDALKGASQWLFDMLNSAASFFVDSSSVWSWATASGGGGAGFGGTEPDCGWYVDYDFSVAQYGWIPDINQGGGAYSGGAWQSTDTHWDSYYRRHVFIQKTLAFNARQVRRIRVTYDLLKDGYTNQPQPNAVYIDRANVAVLYTRDNQNAIEGDGVQVEWLGSTDGQGQRFRVQVMSSSKFEDPSVGGVARVHRIEMWGTGTPP